MDFLNKASKQLTDIFQSMTPGARITAGLLLAVIVISLAYLVQFQSSGGNDLLFAGREFSQAELGNMEAAFGKANLEDYQIEGFRIRVPAGQKAVYLAALAEQNALPHDFDRTMDDVFNASPIFSEPRAVREARLKAAKEKNLSQIIRSMRGIEDARIQFETEEKHGLRKQSETRAIAAIKPYGNTELDEKQIRAIRNTVVAAVAGLKSENVTVTDLNANAAYPGGSGGDLPSVQDSVYLAHKKFYENHYKSKILERLRNYPGVVVGVDVELDTVLSHEEFTRNIDPQTVPLKTTESIDSESTTNSQRGGAPGVTPNTGANRSAVVSNAGVSESTKEKSDTEQVAVASYSSANKHYVPLVLKRVTCSIGVPRSYYAKLWKQRNPTPAGEQPTEPAEADIVALEGDTNRKIQDAVFTLIPKRIQGEDPWAHIQIVRDDDLPMDPIQPPSITDTASTWLAGNWQTLGMALFGAFSLIMLRGMVRSTDTDPDSPTAGEAAPQLQVSESGELGDEESEEGDPQHLKFETSGPNLRAELTQLVKDDPDAAANVLKSWIGDAA